MAHSITACSSSYIAHKIFHRWILPSRNFSFCKILMLEYPHMNLFCLPLPRQTTLGGGWVSKICRASAPASSRGCSGVCLQCKLPMSIARNYFRILLQGPQLDKHTFVELRGPPEPSGPLFRLWRKKIGEALLLPIKFFT